MDLTSSIQSLPQDIQNKIFYYHSHPTAKLIKNIDYKKEFRIHLTRQCKRNDDDYSGWCGMAFFNVGLTRYRKQI